MSYQWKKKASFPEELPFIRYVDLIIETYIIIEKIIDSWYIIQ